MEQERRLGAIAVHAKSNVHIVIDIIALSRILMGSAVVAASSRRNIAAVPRVREGEKEEEREGAASS